MAVLADLRPFVDRVIAGNRIEVMQRMPSVDLIVTDPPYPVR